MQPEDANKKKTKHGVTPHSDEYLAAQALFNGRRADKESLDAEMEERRAVEQMEGGRNEEVVFRSKGSGCVWSLEGGGGGVSSQTAATWGHDTDIQNKKNMSERKAETHTKW